MIPMRMGNKQGKIEWLGLEFGQQSAAEFAQAGASIEDDNVFAGADFNAGGVATVTNGAAPGCGNGAANPPKLYGRRAFDGATLAQVQGEMKLKNAREELFMESWALENGLAFGRVYSIFLRPAGLVAQLVEQCPFKALVRGSSPRQSTSLLQFGWRYDSARSNLTPRCGYTTDTFSANC